MDAYYGRLKKGEDRVEALRNVKIGMLRGQVTPRTGSFKVDSRGIKVAVQTDNRGAKTEIWRHPYYWASFTLSGADGPIDFAP